MRVMVSIIVSNAKFRLIDSALAPPARQRRASKETPLKGDSDQINTGILILSVAMRPTLTHSRQLQPGLGMRIK